MARKQLSEEEKLQRANEKALLNSTKRPKKPNNSNIDTTNTMSEETKTPDTVNPTPDNTTNSTDSTTPNPPVAPVEPTVTTTPADNTGGISDFNPLAGNRKLREYSRPKINVELQDTIIPEDNIKIKETTTQETQSQLTNPNPNQPGAPNTPAPITPLMPGVNNLTEAEKQQGAKQATETFLGLYDKLHFFGRKWIKVEEEDLQEMHLNNELDMYAPFIEREDDPDKEVNLAEFFVDLNKNIDEKFIVTEQFKNEVRPAMERMCVKYGIVLEDGFYLAYKFGEDAATKAVMLAGFKKQINKILTREKKEHKEYMEEVDRKANAKFEEMKRKEAAAAKKAEELAAINEKTKETKTDSTANPSATSEEKK